MRVDVLTSLGDFLALKPEWDELVRAAGVNPLFCSHAWFHCWWQAYASNASLLVMTVRDGHRLGAVAPLMRSRAFLHGLVVSATRLMENGVTPFSQVIATPPAGSALEAIVSCLSSGSGDPLVLLHNLEIESGGLHQWELAFRRHGWRTGRQPGLHSPYLVIQGEWDQFLASRSVRFRKSLRNKINRARRAGELAIQEIQTGPEFEAAYDDLAQIARGSWKARIGAGLCDGGNRDFYHLLAREAGGRGQLSVWLARIDGRPAAYEFHLKDNGVHYALKAEFDESLRDLSPGSLLDYEIVKMLFQRRCRGYHQGGDADFYKLRWSESCRTYSHLLAFRGGIRGAVLWTHEFVMAPRLKAILARLQRPSQAADSRSKDGR